MKKDRVSRLLHSVISTFLMKNFPVATFGLLITVMEVIVTADGRTARVCISFMSLGDGAEGDVKKVMGEIEAAKLSLKRYMSLRLRKKLRRMPDVLFERDEGALNASRIAQILAK